jgi:hypothetical protein
MSGCRGKGRGGRSGRAGRESGGSRGSAYSGGKGKTTKVSLCKDLKGNIFNFRMTLAANQMQIMQEKIVQYISAKYGEDIANKLQNKTRVVLSAPTYSSVTFTPQVLQIALSGISKQR